VQLLLADKTGHIIAAQLSTFVAAFLTAIDIAVWAIKLRLGQWVVFAVSHRLI
jgi:hypothetical protein